MVEHVILGFSLVLNVALAAIGLFVFKGIPTRFM
jgi:hypothetical protein